MDMDNYQKQTTSTAIYNNTSAIDANTAQLAYVVLGLAGEAGEVANKLKKVIRDGGGVITKEQRFALIDELGDVFWYLAQCCEKLDIDLSVVAMNNLNKLAERKKNKSLQGSGDNR